MNIITNKDTRNSSIFNKKKLDDPTQLILIFKVMDLVGIVSLLYGLLLHSAAPSHRDMAPSPCELSVQTLAITLSGLRMLNHRALLDLSILLCALGEEGMWLEFRHMASYLILYSSHHLCEDLLHMASYLILYSSHHLFEDLIHQVILCLGYFTMLQPDNQDISDKLTQTRLTSQDMSDKLTQTRLTSHDMSDKLTQTRLTSQYMLDRLTD
ncbi:hypothetical protein ACOMHN_040246 [Nucella lapillus]